MDSLWSIHRQKSRLSTDSASLEQIQPTHSSSSRATQERIVRPKQATSPVPRASVGGGSPSPPLAGLRRRPFVTSVGRWRSSIPSELTGGVVWKMKEGKSILGWARLSSSLMPWSFVLHASLFVPLSSRIPFFLTSTSIESSSRFDKPHGNFALLFHVLSKYSSIVRTTFHVCMLCHM